MHFVEDAVLPRMKRFTWIILCVFVTSVYSRGAEEQSNPTMDDTAKYFIQLVRQDQYDRFLSGLDPRYKADFPKYTFEKMRAMIPDGEPLSVVVVSVAHSQTPRCEVITYEYHFPGKWLHIQAAVWKESGVPVLYGFAIQSVPVSTQELYTFRLIGKKPVFYFVLALTIIVPLLILYALVKCCRMSGFARWPWIPFILFGIGQFKLSWSTGLWQFHPLVLQLLGAGNWSLHFEVALYNTGKVAALVAPLNLYVSAPIGAIAFLLFHKRTAARPTAVDQNSGEKQNTAPTSDKNSFDF